MMPINTATSTENKNSDKQTVVPPTIEEAITTIHMESQILYLDSRVNRTKPENGLIGFEEPCRNI
jgi:hypothetical protein